MTDKKEIPVVDYFAQAHAVRLTNWFFRTVIVITFRVITAITFAVVRNSERNREW